MADRQTEAYHLVSKNVNSQNTGEKRLFRMSLPMCRVSKTDDDRTLKKKKKPNPLVLNSALRHP